MTTTWICTYRLDFDDGGEPEYGVLHVGTRDECKRVYDLVPAVSYSGDRPVKYCTVGIFEREEAEA